MPQPTFLLSEENIDEIDLEIKAGTNWDVKELVFRDPGMIT